VKAYSQDLRERIVAARLAGQSISEVARIFEVSPAVVQKYWRLHRNGLSLSVGRAPGQPPRLKADQEAAFLAMVVEKSDWTLAQLTQEWQRRSGVLLPRSTLHDHLKRLGGRYKKRAVSPENAAP
jgi:transposase